MPPAKSLQQIPGATEAGQEGGNGAEIEPRQIGPASAGHPGRLRMCF